MEGLSSLLVVQKLGQEGKRLVSEGEAYQFALLISSAIAAPLLPNILPHFRALLNFVINTLPKPVLLALLYRLAILHLASRILPTIGADSWESEDGIRDSWENRPIWWRWMNIFLTLVIWSVELLVSSEEDVTAKDWKVD
ncbi:hypothetical protein C0989_005310 [Termitomyces sp. Mn162]|nr:hypothetical protein C0989_005310 [Termitomyces sp. Mn162]